MIAEAGLGWRVPAAAGGVLKRNSGELCELTSQQLGLVKPSLVAPPPVHRHGNNDVNIAIEGHRCYEAYGERTRQSGDTTVFEDVNQLPEFSFVESESMGAIEAVHPSAAEAAQTVLVERIRSYERGVAGTAPVVGGEWGKIVEAVNTNRIPGGIRKELFAYVALIRKDEVDEGVPRFVDGVRGIGRRFSKPSTREDPPPLR